MKVTVRAKLVEVKRRHLRFEIEAHDEHEQIAKAQHERFIIDTERFEGRIAEKSRKIA